jgi:ATP-dependent RNA helicase SUPV3L1/SUV3
MCGDTFEINYCHRKTPLSYIGRISPNNLQKNDAVILFSRKDVLQFAEEVKKYKLKPSVVYGALPYKARKHQVEMYNSGETDIIISTDAIGMGMNLPIKRVLFAQTEKFDGSEIRDLLPSEIKQIGGRAGRIGKFNEGFVGVVSPYYIEDFTIKNGLETKNKQISTAYIPFPEELLKHSDDKLSNILINWSSIKYPKIFKQQDLTMTIEKVLYLEKNYKTLDKFTILKLSTVMFDEKEEVLFVRWQQHVDDFINNVKKQPPLVYGESLKDWELKYKELDLYYSFNKSMNLEIDTETLQKSKEEVIEKINRLLINTNSKKPKQKKCRNCGKKLPLGYKYDTCEWCHYFSKNRY